MMHQAERECEMIVTNAKHNASRIVNEALIEAEKATSYAKSLQKNIKALKSDIKSEELENLENGINLISALKELKDKFAGIALRDVQNAMMQAKDIEIPEGKTIIDIVPSEVVLDNGKVVSDPVGNLSSNFTLKAQIILADKEYVRQLATIFKRVGIEIDGIVPTALAERNLMLDTNELYDNVMLLDIGAGNTEIGVFEGNAFTYTNTIPLGGDNITNDIALVLNISEEEAEKLKKQYGLALKSFIDNDNEIMLNTCRDESRNKVIKSSELIEIIEARIEEIFTIINKDITTQNVKQNINTVILAGRGITNINKSDVAGKINLNIPVKMSTGRAVSTVKPEFRTSYALVRYIAARPFAKSVSSKIDSQSNESIFKVIIERIKEFFRSSVRNSALVKNKQNYNFYREENLYDGM